MAGPQLLSLFLSYIPSSLLMAAAFLHLPRTEVGSAEVHQNPQNLFMKTTTTAHRKVEEEVGCS